MDAVQAYIDNPEMTTRELMEYHAGPGFSRPAAVIANKSELRGYLRDRKREKSSSGASSRWSLESARRIRIS
ncbi:MAG: hypothetical protein ACLTW9_23195 [Enterocloster sp.]